MGTVWAGVHRADGAQAMLEQCEGWMELALIPCAGMDREGVEADLIGKVALRRTHLDVTLEIACSPELLVFWSQQT